MRTVQPANPRHIRPPQPPRSLTRRKAVLVLAAGVLITGGAYLALQPTSQAPNRAASTPAPASPTGVLGQQLQNQATIDGQIGRAERIAATAAAQWAHNAWCSDSATTPSGPALKTALTTMPTSPPDNWAGAGIGAPQKGCQIFLNVNLVALHAKRVAEAPVKTASGWAVTMTVATQGVYANAGPVSLVEQVSVTTATTPPQVTPTALIVYAPNRDAIKTATGIDEDDAAYYTNPPDSRWASGYGPPSTPAQTPAAKGTTP